jgi:Amt family ammonium transporter
MPGPYSNVVYSEREAINAVWVLVSTAMIFFMQAGFALLECGSVRAKNSTSILIKNLFDACVGSIAFWLVGYGFAFGDVKSFIGGSPDYFAASGFENTPEDHYLLWIFHFAFASTSATIVSGSLAERT